MLYKRISWQRVFEVNVLWDNLAIVVPPPFSPHLICPFIMRPTFISTLIYNDLYIVYKSTMYTVSASIIRHSWLIHHYNKIWINRHFFFPKSPLFESFWGKNPTNSNKPSPSKNPKIFTNRWQWRSIDADTVIIIVLTELATKVI